MNVFRNRLVTLGVSGLLAAGVLGGAGIALAQPGPGQGAEEGPRHHRLVQIALKNVIAISGLSPEVFKQGFQDGKSIDQILVANGKSPDAIQAALLDQLEDKLNELEAEGKLTEEQVEKALDRAPEALDKLFSHVPDPDREPGGRGEGGRRGEGAVKALRGLMKSAAGAIGITPQQLRKELQGDDTVADVAAAHNVPAATVIDEMVAGATAALEKARDAGKIDQAQYEKAVAGLEARITKLVNEGLPKKPGS